MTEQSYTKTPLPDGDYARLVYVDARGNIHNAIGRIGAAKIAGVALMKIERIDDREISTSPFYLGAAGIASLELLTCEEAQREVNQIYSGDGR